MKKLLCKRTLLGSSIAVCGFLFIFGLACPTPAQAQAKPKDSVVLPAAMGGVKFEHKLHVDRAEKKCDTCHHPSKPEKALKAPQEACADCHTKPTQAGMKTGLPAAFHNPLAKSGTCIDCHIKENASGKKAPVKCMDCHKKANG
jgi:Class III cytochrome C family